MVVLLLAMKNTDILIRAAFHTLLFAILIPVLFSCSKKNMSSTNTITTTDPTAKKYLALGDSYTIGQSVAEAEKFPNQTVFNLRAQ